MSDHGDDPVRSAERKPTAPSVGSIFANASAPTPAGFTAVEPSGPGVDTRACRRCGSPRVGDPRATTCSFCGTPFFFPEEL